MLLGGVGGGQGFAYVDFYSATEAARAAERLNGHGYNHLILQVTAQAPRRPLYPPRAGGPPGGFGGGPGGRAGGGGFNGGGFNGGGFNGGGFNGGNGAGGGGAAAGAWRR